MEAESRAPWHQPGSTRNRGGRGLPWPLVGARPCATWISGGLQNWERTKHGCSKLPSALACYGCPRKLEHLSSEATPCPPTWPSKWESSTPSPMASTLWNSYSVNLWWGWDVHDMCD